MQVAAADEAIVLGRADRIVAAVVGVVAGALAVAAAAAAVLVAGAKRTQEDTGADVVVWVVLVEGTLAAGIPVVEKARADQTAVVGRTEDAAVDEEPVVGNLD